MHFLGSTGLFLLHRRGKFQKFGLLPLDDLPFQSLVLRLDVVVTGFEEPFHHILNLLVVETLHFGDILHLHMVVKIELFETFKELESSLFKSMGFFTEFGEPFIARELALQGGLTEILTFMLIIRYWKRLIWKGVKSVLMNLFR